MLNERLQKSLNSGRTKQYKADGGSHDPTRYRRDMAKNAPARVLSRELERAEREALVINFRVARPPIWDDALEGHGWRGWPYGADLPKCYTVHGGAVRGWCHVLGTCWREDGEVAGWPAGWYVVRNPLWHSVTPIPMKGFQGWVVLLKMTEQQIVRRLEALTRDWPGREYMIASMGGTLCLFRTNDYLMGRPGDESLDPDKALWMTSRIPNTGGDW